MSDFRLLIAIEVVDYLRTLRRSDQEKLLNHFRNIAAHPTAYSDYFEKDLTGRALGVHILGQFAIKFWNDEADKHLKILDVHLADR